MEPAVLECRCWSVQCLHMLLLMGAEAAVRCAAGSAHAGSALLMALGRQPPPKPTTGVFKHHHTHMELVLYRAQPPCCLGVAQVPAISLHYT